MSLRDIMKRNMIGEAKSFRHIPRSFPDLEDTMTDLGRFYITPDNKTYPSITTVLSILSKDSIAKWREKVGDEEADRISRIASERGTRIHEMCENYINGNIDKLHEMEYRDHITFKSIKPIIDHYVDDIVVQEVALYSHNHEVAGRTDCIANYQGKLSIIDFKTSRKQKKKSWIKSYFMQGAAYATMYEEMTSDPIEQIVIIIACDEGEPQVFIEKRDDWLDQFKNTRDEFRKLHGI